ncbi:nuclear transport factor 2 family protein [Streptomyces cinereospinus]|uniref:Nuclear transport factor 2 family protein n=1 Tax=Streptomyces cinereospinus TaxID=285561 RepID=A0ABV5N7T4_9ACTN
MNAVSDITQLVLKERQGRDRGWWQQMHDSFHPDSTVTLSWFDGTGPEFTARSKDMYDSGLRPLHRLRPPVVHVDGNRAVVELPAAVSANFLIDGVEAQVVSHARLLYRAEDRGTGWRIQSLDSVYEQDTLAPVVPGTTLVIDQDLLATFRKPYRFLAYHITLDQRDVRDDLYADDRPDEVDALYRRLFTWLRAPR